MIPFLYTIIIYPAVQIIELCYLFAYRLCGNFALAIIGVSLAVSLLTLPLYVAAEKAQKAEREKQKKMLPYIKKIKSVFFGDEQYMILSAYYRQNHYHPVYALRNTFSLLIQVPFFIAAYGFLSHLSALEGVRFFCIPDLSKPDGLLSIAGIHINLLPVLMTALNYTSAAVYTKGITVQEKIQMFILPLVFLFLLYNSPAALALYWSCNNAFSLAKNMLARTKRRGRIISAGLAFCMTAAALYIIFIHEGALNKRIAAAAAALFTACIPFIYTKTARLLSVKRLTAAAANAAPAAPVFGVSAAALFILCGFALPAGLTASSPGEFSYIGSFSSPFPFLINTCIQAAGLFLVYPICIYVLSPRRFRPIYAAVYAALSLCALVNSFFFYRDYGWLTPTLIFSSAVKQNMRIASDDLLFAVNAAVVLLVCVIVVRLYFSSRRTFLFAVQTALCAALLGWGFINVWTTHAAFIKIETNRMEDMSVMGGGGVYP